MKFTYSLHTVYTKDLHPDLAINFKKMCQEIGIQVKMYEKTSVNHGEWMTDVMRLESEKDVVGFLDIDLYISHKDELIKLLYYAYKFNTITGLSYSNNSNGKNYVNVSTFCFIISSKLYLQLRRPNFGVMHEYIKDLNAIYVYDTGENIVRMAEKIGKKVFTYFPTSYEKNNTKNINEVGPTVFRLSYYGVFGAGTIYQDKFFHLGESRYVSKISEKYKRYYHEPITLLNTNFEFFLNNKKFLKGKHSCTDFRIPYFMIDEYITLGEDIKSIKFERFFPRKQLKEILNLPFSKDYVFL